MLELTLCWGAANKIDLIERHLLLHAAVMSDKGAIIHFLNTQGAEVDHRYNRGVQSMHLACLGGHLESIRCLLVAGARVVLHGLHRPSPSALHGVSGVKLMAKTSFQSLIYYSWLGRALIPKRLTARKASILHARIVRQTP